MAKVTTVEIAAKLTLFEDSKDVYNQAFSMNVVTYTEHSVDRLVLATNSGWQEINMGGVSTGVYLEVKVDRPILVSLNTTTKEWNVGKGTKGGVLAMISEFTHIYVQNESITNTVIVNAAIADQNA